jgi:hypothetical protein
MDSSSATALRRYKDKFASLGVAVQRDEVIAASYMAAYFSEADLKRAAANGASADGAGGNILAFGCQGLMDELQLAVRTSACFCLIAACAKIRSSACGAVRASA